MDRSFPFTDLHLAGAAGRPAVCFGATDLTQTEEKTETGAVSVLSNGIRMEAVCSPLPGGVMRQYTLLRNESETPVKLESVASLVYQGIDGEAFTPGRFLFRICQSTWGGEGQWRVFPPEDAGLYPSENHTPLSFFRLSSSGTWSSGKYYPLLLIEDTAEKKVWYFEMECGSSWMIEVGASRLSDGKDHLCVFASGTCCLNDGWHKTLGAEETFRTPSVLYGCAAGNWENALHALIKAKRETSCVRYPGGKIPVIYNDFMNALWGKPTEASLRPLVLAAKKAGAEIFCIDAGWFRSRLPRHTHWYGDWIPGDDLFGEGGFAGFISFIRSQGLKAGMWFEMEICQIGSRVAAEHPDWLLHRDGEIIAHNLRHFFDFRKKEVRDYLEAVVRHFHKIGIRYIKNDYNASVGYGCDGDEPAAESLRQNTLAFYAFMETLTRRYPDTVFENCGSGAMREDNLTLSHFHLQSVSDQEDYLHFPAILQGALALLPPEKAGVWSYPYPVPYTPLTDLSVFTPDDAYRARMASGRQTAFNTVTSLFGCMMLSGGLHLCDEKNAALLAEGVRVYKRLRGMIPGAYPIYPEGLTRLRQNGFLSLGLHNPERREILLGVWKIRTEEEKHTLSLAEYLPETARVHRIYPRDEGITYRFSRVTRTLHVTFPKEENAAVAFLIRY